MEKKKIDELENKMLTYGCLAMSDIELMGVMLNDFNAAEQLASFTKNNFKVLAAMTPSDLFSVPGVTKKKATKIVAALEIGRRKNIQSLDLEILRSSADIYAYVKEKISDSPVELFCVILLNRANKIVHFQQVSSGSIVGTVADPRIIIKLALDYKAVTMIVAHNHPSGNLKPSNADEQLTRKIKEGAKLFDILLLDHIIVSHSGYYSFADEGII